MTNYTYEFPNINQGMDEAVLGVMRTVDVFVPMFLLFVFGFVLIAGMTAQKRRTGMADMPLWSTMASLSTLMITLSLSLYQGIVDLYVLGVVVSITLASGIWLFTSQNRNEV